MFIKHTWHQPRIPNTAGPDLQLLNWSGENVDRGWIKVWLGERREVTSEIREDAPLVKKTQHDMIVQQSWVNTQSAAIHSTSDSLMPFSPLGHTSSGSDAIVGYNTYTHSSKHSTPGVTGAPAYSIAFIRLMQWMEQVSAKIPFLFKPPSPYQQPNPIRPNWVKSTVFFS